MTRNWVPLVAVVFAATLAYVVGVRLSESAMAVVIGVVFGVAASVPMSLILMVALGRTGTYREPRVPSERQQPTIIVTPPTIPSHRVNPWSSGMPGQIYLPPLDEGDIPTPRRTFHIIGGEED